MLVAGIGAVEMKKICHFSEHHFPKDSESGCKLLICFSIHIESPYLTISFYLFQKTKSKLSDLYYMTMHIICGAEAVCIGGRKIKILSACSCSREDI